MKIGTYPQLQEFKSFMFLFGKNATVFTALLAVYLCVLISGGGISKQDILSVTQNNAIPAIVQVAAAIYIAYKAISTAFNMNKEGISHTQDASLVLVLFVLLIPVHATAGGSIMVVQKLAAYLIEGITRIF